ncbi:MAG: hypothetical protein KatS3mg113_0132 [Planctomycetaceae bacterium]|nr:MAG: hypothetical protein KatS3mg113_0132 [Planctomycetaceae bacterium]
MIKLCWRNVRWYSFLTALWIGWLPALQPIWGQVRSVPKQPPKQIAPPNDIGIQYSRPQARANLVESSNLIRVPQARTQFNVDGTGLTAAIMDTGLRTTHVDFTGKVIARRNFTTDYGGNPNNVNDLDGHGTHVAGIVLANGIGRGTNHLGIAPGARVAPLKVLRNDGTGDFTWVRQALDWVIANRTTYNITVVNMSLGDGFNYTTDFGMDEIRQRIITLRNNRVPVIIAAGNDFYSWGSEQGMSYPAIIPESISVGAVYDADIGYQDYFGPIAFTTGPRRITPFSQRLHQSVSSTHRTDVFAPGAALTSSGILNDTAEATYQGTSMAAPVVAGLCLLAQQLSLRLQGQLPTVDQLERWLRITSTTVGNLIMDGDDEDDNVVNTGLQFIMSDALLMLTQERSELVPTPPADPSNITASYHAGSKTLTISGDAAGSGLTITRQGNRVTLSGGTYTRINGRSSVSFNIVGSFNLVGNLQAGDDNLSLIALQLNSLQLNLGDGNDQLVLNYCTIVSSQCDGGAGTDTLISTTSRITNNLNTGFP